VAETAAVRTAEAEPVAVADLLYYSIIPILATLQRLYME
jgi:hypothetical protein